MMASINPEGQSTRKERLATVIALAASVFFHLFVFLGGLQLYQWAEEDIKKERLMVVRRVRDVSPQPERAARQTPVRPQPPPEARVAEPGPEPPRETPELPGEMRDELQDAEGMPPEEEEEEEEEKAETSVSVLTDLPAATFTVGGLMEFHGAGTFWIKKDVPPGGYTATFHPVPGYNTPPVQSKTLPEGGEIVFVGKYSRKVEVVVETNLNEAQGVTFEIYRPDGVSLGMHRAGRAFFDDLPPGNYTIVFKGVSGFVTPAPQSKSLQVGGSLSFSGIYQPVRVASVRRVEPAASPAARQQTRIGLDRRVQMIIKSYPATSIEEDYRYIEYPEVIIERSDFQKGWCQVYLVLTTDERGAIVREVVKRPQREEQEEFKLLIETVQEAARSWDYERAAAEVHVDVRFYVE